MASPYDPTAERFERQRALPGGVVRSVRGAVMAALKHLDRPRLLDLGAGGGRFGWPFVAAGDDYVGVDLSAGMLRVFADRCAGGVRAMLVQADGGALPFPDASFDAVLLIAVFGDLSDWRPLVGEARRVLRSPRGAIIIGRTGAPDHGIDERMRQRLDTLLEERMPGLGMRRRRCAAGCEEAVRYLAVAEDALRALGEWAQTEFGTLEAGFAETHCFDMRLFRFARG